MHAIHGASSYGLDCLRPRATTSPRPAPPRAELDFPGPTRRYADVFSNKHEKLLLRVEHVERLENIRNWFNTSRRHPEQPALMVADIVNACLDFAFDHPIPFQRLGGREEIGALVAKHLSQSVVARWRQFNEVF